jgi:hypothetical protein
MHRSHNLIGNFKKRSFISVVLVAKPKNIDIFTFTDVLESFALCYGDFCMDFCSVDSDEALKRGDEALNSSSLQFLRSVKRFIASSLQLFSQR